MGQSGAVGAVARPKAIPRCVALVVPAFPALMLGSIVLVNIAVGKAKVASQAAGIVGCVLLLLMLLLTFNGRKVAKFCTSSVGYFLLASFLVMILVVLVTVAAALLFDALVMGSLLHLSAACAIIFGLMNFGMHFLADPPAEVVEDLVRSVDPSLTTRRRGDCHGLF
eukprot:NODE_4081_length_712_cov_374.444444.p1 GENE.NODE_4081_length_712_cov_374.444444~~NODE_4081_length_712_cov_374.444444.p1  ORF type:complete len:167 (+),score=61.58 NODE_4081_length_712_cov_374.444444:3-503(+)